MAAILKQHTASFIAANLGKLLPHVESTLLRIGFCRTAAMNGRKAQERLAVISGCRLLTITSECRELAEKLMTSKAVPDSEPRDAPHIAIAAVHDVKYLLTWNFAHIANASMRHKIELFIREAGFNPPIICTPQELVLDDTNE